MRTLKSKLTEYMRVVKAGTTIVVTERGREIARIIPDTDSGKQTLAVLRTAGAVLWSGRRLKKSKRGVPVQGAGTVSEILLENRNCAPVPGQQRAGKALRGRTDVRSRESADGRGASSGDSAGNTHRGGGCTRKSDAGQPTGGPCCFE